MAEDKRKKRPMAFTVFYAAFVAYLSVMIFGSMLVSLYGTPDAATMDEMWCKGELATLHAELGNQAQQELQALNPSERTGDRWKRWQTDWSDRFQRASTNCKQTTDLLEGFAILNELSTDYGGVLQELSGARVHLRNHLDTLILKLKGTPF